MYMLFILTWVGSPYRVRQHSFVETDHEIFSTVIFPFHWFKKDRCQFMGKEYAQVLVNHLERTKPAKEKVWLGKKTTLDMTLLIGWLGCKTPTKTNSLLKRDLLQKESICSLWEGANSFLLSRFLCRRDLMSRKTNKKSQKLIVTFVKMVETLPSTSVYIHLNIFKQKMSL